jgi:hypothetical protein
MTATMTDVALHPWLCTPEAMRAAEAATFGVSDMKAATGLEHDEVLSQALRILCECALPPRERGDEAGRCGIARSASEPIGGYVGSMHSWPEDRMQEYAVRELMMALRIWLRMRNYRDVKARESVSRISSELEALTRG